VMVHSYLPIFIFIGSAYLIAFILVHLLIGKIGIDDAEVLQKHT
jgi:hypothetical protein